MKLARFWTRKRAEAVGGDGRRVEAVARGWSNESPAAAAQVAQDIAGRVAQKLASGDMRKGHYLYGDRPLPEPILYEFGGGGAEPRAAITRNVYGALVMNARNLMFIDIDREGNAVLGEIERAATAAGIDARVYRTAAGYRVMVTNYGFEPGASNSEALLRQFGADPLYVKLCQMQQSFRARLTPKPWRCGLRLPPVAFPFETPRDQAMFDEWDQRYSAAIAGYATCQYVASFPGQHADASFHDLIEYHDQVTKAGASMPLA